VPLTLSSKLPFPIGVQLSIRSSEITFPKGSRRVIKLRRGTATVSLPVVVKALGTFAASAVVSAPNGAVLVTSNLTVHSTGFSTVGVVLTVGAALVLVCVVGSHRAPSPQEDERLVFAQLKRLLFGTRESASQNAALLAAGTLTSRLTGLVRLVALAVVLGVRPLADAYNLGNNTPNMLYDLLLGA